jgi:hypothetical protein
MMQKIFSRMSSLKYTIASISSKIRISSRPPSASRIIMCNRQPVGVVIKRVIVDTLQLRMRGRIYCVTSGFTV